MREVLLAHAGRYPGMEPRDVVKLLYQSEFGNGHMIDDENKSLKRLENEYEEVTAAGRGCGVSPGVESIGGGYCRVHLASLPEGLSMETLHRLFVLSAGLAGGSREAFEKKLGLFLECCRDGSLEIGPAAAEAYLEQYRAAGLPAVSHSETYRRLYRPAYRVIAERYARFLTVFADIDRALAEAAGQAAAETGGEAAKDPAVGERPVTVAIDGPCAAGKTTLSGILAEVYDCNVFHMDHFFLRPEQRTEERLSEVGGNVDYERFREEVVEPLKKRQPVRCRIYDCAQGRLAGEVDAPVKRLSIVEGSYSLHPYFGEYYDLAYCLAIDPEEQVRRIRERSGEAMLERFIREWIPKENAYLETFGIRRRPGVILIPADRPESVPPSAE